MLNKLTSWTLQMTLAAGMVGGLGASDTYARDRDRDYRSYQKRYSDRYDRGDRYWRGHRDQFRYYGYSSPYRGFGFSYERPYYRPYYRQYYYHSPHYGYFGYHSPAPEFRYYVPDRGFGLRFHWHRDRRW